MGGAMGCHLPGVVQLWPTASQETQSSSLIQVLFIAALVLHWQSCKVVTVSTWLTKPKIFTI